jgi:hypothetical protein
VDAVSDAARLDYIVSKTFLDAGILYPHPEEVMLRSAQVGHMLACFDSWAEYGLVGPTQEEVSQHAEDCNHLRGSVWSEDTQTRVRFPCSCPASQEESHVRPTEA